MFDGLVFLSGLCPSLWKSGGPFLAVKDKLKEAFAQMQVLPDIAAHIGPQTVALGSRRCVEHWALTRLV
eukprot:2878503-Amphidinium_carterae.1